MHISKPNYDCNEFQLGFFGFSKNTLLTRWIATAALRDGNAVEPLALKPAERLVDDKSIEATAAVECDGAAHDSR